MKFEVMTYREYTMLEEEWYEVEAENAEEAKRLASRNKGVKLDNSTVDCLNAEWVDFDEWTVEEKK